MSGLAPFKEFPAGTEGTEKKASAFKRELILASALFIFMFGAVLTLGSLILLKDLGDKEVFRMLGTYSKELETQLKQVPSTQTLKGYQQQKVIVTRLNLFLTDKKIFDSYRLYDDQGKLVKSADVLRGGELFEGAPPENLLPGQQQVLLSKKIPVVVDVPIEPGKVGKAIFAVSQDVLARQAQDFRNEMMIKVLLMVGTILLLLALAYLYILRVLRVSRRIESEAQDQERLSYLGLLSSGMAHEIKNPLNSIQMNLQLLEEEVHSGGDPKSLADWIEPIRKEVRRLEQLVNDFLLYARPLRPQITGIQLEPLLRSLVQFVEQEASQRQVSLELDVDPEISTVDADESLLRTALLNLILNAIQALPGGGKVTVGARAEGGRLLLDIRDSGSGIPAERSEEVFQIFFTTKPGGTGLGLPIARRIAECHGGTLTLAEPTASGDLSGACVRLCIPLRRAA